MPADPVAANTATRDDEREPIRERVYWWAWFKWHSCFDWCLCRCDFCGHRLVHAATCEGSSRIRRRA